jgi:hypothetical protein
MQSQLRSVGMLAWRRFRSPCNCVIITGRGQRYFSPNYSNHIRVHPVPSSVDTRGVFPRSKTAGEADHSPPSSVEVKMAWNCISSSPYTTTYSGTTCRTVSVFLDILISNDSTDYTNPTSSFDYRDRLRWGLNVTNPWYHQVTVGIRTNWNI